MSDYDFWEEQEQAEREYDAQQEEIADAYERGYEKGRADTIENAEMHIDGLKSIGRFNYESIKVILEQLKEQKE